MLPLALAVATDGRFKTAGFGQNYHVEVSAPHRDWAALKCNNASLPFGTQLGSNFPVFDD